MRLPTLLLLFPLLTCTHLTTITFDDLPVPPSSGIGPLPPLHSHLSFSAYNIFTPRSPALSDYLPIYDHNCATSLPNALIGSRSHPRQGYEDKGAYFFVGNETGMREVGLEAWFTLVGMKVKPVAVVEGGGGTRVRVKGFKSGDRRGDGEEGEKEEVVEWHVEFPEGYREVFEVKMGEYSREDWGRLVGVEVVAEYGPDGLDWEVCVDDLVVEFTATGEAGKKGGEEGGQVVLAD